MHEIFWIPSAEKKGSLIKHFVADFGDEWLFQKYKGAIVSFANRFF